MQMVWVTLLTSVYPAKGLPGSRPTKLDSGAQKRLIRFPIEGYGPCTQARVRLARAAVVPQASAQASARTRTAGQRASPVGTFSKSAILHLFPNFNTLRVEIFPMFLSVYVYLWPLWTMKSFSMEINPHVFEKSGRQTNKHTHTDRRGSFIYIEENSSVFCVIQIYKLPSEGACR